MKTIIHYGCEICSCVFNTQEEAEECEAKGLPDPVPWFPFNEEVYAWGENGPMLMVATGVYVVNRFGYSFKQSPHEWALDTLLSTTALSHNAEYGQDFMFYYASPLKGYDAFRYSEKKEDAVLWRSQLKRFGLMEEDAIEYVRGNIRKIDSIPNSK